MRKSILVRLSASTLLAATLGVGLVHAASGNISDTGPHSNNRIQSDSRNSSGESNNSSVNVNNQNNQTARSGSAIVRGNTFGGSANTGNASNSNNTSTNVSVPSSGASFVAPVSGSNNASISNTGPRSNNQIDLTNRNSVNVSNHTNVNVNNQNHQTATTGNAIVSGNTYGGSTSTGNAANYNSTSTNVNTGSSYVPMTNYQPSYANNADNYRQPMVYSEVGAPVYVESNNYGSNMSGRNYSSHVDSYQTEQHQDNRYPVSRNNYPTKSNGGLYGSNPCATVSEVSYARHDDHNYTSYNQRRVVPVVHYVSRPVVIRRPVYVQPCPVIAHPVVRPPCPVVVTPCHPAVVPCRPVVAPCKPIVVPCHPVVVPCHQQQRCQPIVSCNRHQNCNKGRC